MIPWVPHGVELSQDVSAADWIVERIRPSDSDGPRLWSFMPDVFEAYARVFHPPGHRPASRDFGRKEPVTWAALAAKRGLSLTPDISFTEVTGVEPASLASFEPLPAESGLPWDTCEAVARVLRPHTKTSDICWFALWEGNGALWSSGHSPPHFETIEAEKHYWDEAKKQDDFLHSAARFDIPNRRYFLFRGPLDGACGFEPAGWHHSPNFWWPDDRSWLVSTEVDGYSTYVGGTRAAVMSVIGSLDLEAIEVSIDVHMDPELYEPRWRPRIDR